MRILLATDGSKYSDEAAKFLTGLNLSPEDELTVVHVIGWITPVGSMEGTQPTAGEMERYYAGLKELKHQIAPRIIESTVKILEPVKAKVSTVVAEGYPDRSIIGTAMVHNADMVVMGEKGVTSIKTLFIGGVTRAVAINSPMSVCVIKPSRQEGPTKILFATDGSQYANATGKLLATIPFPDDTELTILNVIRSVTSDIPERFASVMNERVKEGLARARSLEYAEAEKIIEQARKLLVKKFKKIEEVTKVGDPLSNILEVAEASKADIIAVGSRGLRGVRGMLGSVSRYVLTRSKCSVLVGKAA